MGENVSPRQEDHDTGGYRTKKKREEGKDDLVIV
jgi:hypothetical protein